MKGPAHATLASVLLLLLAVAVQVSAVSVDVEAMVLVEAQARAEIEALAKVQVPVLEKGTYCSCLTQVTASHTVIFAQCTKPATFEDPDIEYLCHCQDLTPIVCSADSSTNQQTKFLSFSKPSLCDELPEKDWDAPPLQCLVPPTFEESCRSAPGITTNTSSAVTVTGAGTPQARTTCVSETIRTGCQNDGFCPNEVVDCRLSEWSPFSGCTKECGGGTRTRNRTILQQPVNGGAACPGPEALTETESCNTQLCPVFCEVTAFSEWSQCKHCGETQSRTRTIKVVPKNGAPPCPELLQTRPCDDDGTCKDCVMSGWTDFGLCTKQCGGGFQSRHREVIIQPSVNGAECGEVEQTIPCNLHECPVDCVVSEWVDMDGGHCSKQCGGGVKKQSRKILTPASNGGSPCPVELEREIACNSHPCPVDCKVGEWGPFSDCSTTCGIGRMTRYRPIQQEPLNGGQPCPVLEEELTCENKTGCTCEYSPYTDWTECSVMCGGGVRTRSRELVANSGNITCPGPYVDTEGCNLQPCDVDCVVTNFTEWGVCSESCGGGVQERVRSVLADATGNGVPCPELRETRPCNEHHCPVNCSYGEWTEWGQCSVTCGSGSRERTRSILVPGQHGGTPCDEPTIEHQSCTKGPCPIDCSPLETWGAWTPCDKSCGGGLQSRTKQLFEPRPKPDNENELHCVAAGSHVEHRECNLDPCPIDCIVGDFGEWSQCDKPCGVGHQSRYLEVIQESAFGGRECPPLEQTRVCNTEACPIHCKVSNWTEWTPCSGQCGGGVRSRTRSVIQAPNQTGDKCPALSDTQVCNTHECRNCTVSEWGPYSTCSKPCGGGIRQRSRTVVQHPDVGGTQCPPLVEEVPCNQIPCPVDCKLGQWSEWSICSAKCGGGTRTRTMSIATDAAFGGRACPASELLIEEESCNDHSCEVDCVVGEWTPFSACSAACGGGVTTRTRPIKQHPSNGGLQCPQVVQTLPCNPEPCAVDCEVSQWSSWSECTHKCGSGLQTRRRNVTHVSRHGGKSCPNLSEQRVCNSQACQVEGYECKTSSWSAFSPCSAECGKSGTRTATRTVTAVLKNSTSTPAVSVSAATSLCGSEYMTVECNTQPCPVHCQVTGWSAWTVCSSNCDEGFKTRTRTVVESDSNGGMRCPTLVENRECNLLPCARDCRTSDFGEWSPCSHKCGAGFKTRTRKVTSNSAFGGASCPQLHQSVTCHEVEHFMECDAHCETGDWSPFTQCSATCGGGMMKRERAVSAVTCGDATQVHPCNTQPCPVNCATSPFGQWRSCNERCGAGEQTAIAHVTTPNSNGGQACSNLLSVQPCNAGECVRPSPVPIPNPYPIPSEKTDCVVSEWGPWGNCTAVKTPCGTTAGQRVRNRTVVSEAVGGGAPCPPLSMTQACEGGSLDENSGSTNGTGVGEVHYVTSFTPHPTTCNEGAHGSVKLVPMEQQPEPPVKETIVKPLVTEVKTAVPEEATQIKTVTEEPTQAVPQVKA